MMDVWLGAETGLLKGVSVSRKQAVNFSSCSRLSREREVRALSWSGAVEKEVLVGSADGLVRTFSTDTGTFTHTRRCGEPGEGCFSGLVALGSGLATCTDTGAVRVWREDSDEPVTELRAGEHVNRMRQSSTDPHKVATGGKENPLKIWDLEKPDKPVFSAKNLRDSWLDLRQPHWVKDMAFVPQSAKVVTCTGYHQVHVYDPSTPQRRPVLEAGFGEYPLTALSLPLDGNTVAVANTQGQMALLDLRKGVVRGALSGPTGSVRGLQCHPSLPLIASCGLDRFLYIHDLQTRKLQHKVYLKSRLNCVLLSSRDLNAEAGLLQVKQEEEEQDEVWDAMEHVHEDDKGVHKTEESVHETEESVHETEESVQETEESVHETEECVHKKPKRKAPSDKKHTQKKTKKRKKAED